MANEMLKKALLTFSQEEFLLINEICATQNWTPSKQFRQKTEKIIKNNRSINAGRILLIAAVVFLLSVTTVFSFADLRENIINTFKEFYHTHFDMEYGNTVAGDISGDGIKKVYTLSSLPYSFEQTDYSQNEHSVITIWENKYGETIILSQGDGITKRSIDNERLIQSMVVIDGIEYDVYSENGYILVLWNTAEYTFSIDYYGEHTINEIADLIHLTEVTQ